MIDSKKKNNFIKDICFNNKEQKSERDSGGILVALYPNWAMRVAASKEFRGHYPKIS
jgi:hypothetical protein